ncbi:LD-carboxypeptidase [bacterium]|nr:LD-carboxypeptidase [bacterium]
MPCRYEAGKKQLQDEFHVQVVEGKYTLKDPQRIYEHPEARAEDLMEALKDPSIKAIISSI